MNEILKKRIEEAAREYAGNQTGLDYIGETACEQGFIDGAEYAFSHQWMKPKRKKRTETKRKQTKTGRTDNDV